MRMSGSEILLCDENNFDIDSLSRYQKIFFMGIAPLKHEKLVSIPLHTYFMKAHSTARKINKKLLDISSIQPELHLSLLKLVDLTIFNNARVIEILKDLPPHDNVTIKIDEPQYLESILDIIGLKSDNIIIPIRNKRTTTGAIVRKFFKLSVLIFNSFKVKKSNKENVFFMYNDKVAFEFAKPYLDNCITFPFLSPELNQKINKYGATNFIQYKFVSIYQLFHGAVNFIKNRKEILSSNVPTAVKTLYCSQLIELEINSMMILSLKNKLPNLENILGLFDAYSCIDYVTFNLNKRYKIQTVCIPHGINFQYKVHYISYGVNTYTFWSKDHYKRMERSNLQQSVDVKKIVTGNIVYKNTLANINSTRTDGNKKILVVGEYFSQDNFYSSPFNHHSAKVFFNVLDEFIQRNTDCNLTIRTRLNDDYSKLAKNYTSDRIELSSPTKFMIDEINESDLIITIFSNALHEALLLNKKVLQVNLLGVENYRGLAKNDLVFYADSAALFSEQLDSWNAGKLPKLDYNKHLLKYCNYGCFNPVDIKSKNEN